jgi:putative restriction endonuclease
MGMDSELIARISPSHQHRLAWFEEHQGELLPFPGPLPPKDLLLVSRQREIYKPGNLDYALSIRINLDRPYADGVPVPTPGGGWLLSYHQDNADPPPDTNEALRRCIADRVPVGVLRERAPARHDTRYDVLGLALPVRWSDGYFFFESLDPPAQPVTDPVSDVLEATARAELEQETPPGGEGLGDDYDARLRVYRQIVARSGQPGFRAALLEAYQGRCAMTGCDAPAALEAAHLRPYRGPDSNTVTNGLLLRADIHTLLDLRLLVPDPVTRTITVSKLLAGTQYEALATCQLADPGAAWQRPDQDALEITWQDFRAAEDDR